MTFTRTELIALLGNPAFLHDTEIPILARYAQQVRCGPIVEIGAAFGASAVIFLANSPRYISVHSIDPFIADPISGWNASTALCKQSVRRALQYVHRLSEYNRWQLHVTRSHNLAMKWNQSIELLFIDGDHHYRGVRMDFDDWEKFIQPGGIILLHDSRHNPAAPNDVCTLDGDDHGGLPGPTQLAKELRDHPRFELIETGFTLTIWRRRDVHDFYYPETV